MKFNGIKIKLIFFVKIVVFFLKGEHYTLLSRNEDDWCYIRDKNGNIGCVPGSYLEIKNEDCDSTDSIKMSHLDKE